MRSGQDADMNHAFITGGFRQERKGGGGKLGRKDRWMEGGGENVGARDKNHVAEGGMERKGKERC